MESWTITYCDCGENHVGNQQIGKIAKKGISINRLKKAKKKFEKDEFKCELINLNENLQELDDFKEIQEANVLIVRNFFKDFSENLKEELEIIETDKKYYDRRRKKVLNKHARHNVCFDDVEQEPDYENKKGRIVSFENVPYVNQIRNLIPKYFGKKYGNLKAELNHYYDINKCGIGYHGDTERKWVFGAKIGDSMTLCYQWYKRGKKIGNRIDLNLNDGDLYIMSEKAVGFDWKRRTIMTLRHASGCHKFIK